MSRWSDKRDAAPSHSCHANEVWLDKCWEPSRPGEPQTWWSVSYQCRACGAIRHQRESC